MDLVKVAIPFFFALIAIELAAGLLMRRRVYRVNDTVSDIGCGLVNQFSGITLAVLVIVAYAQIVDNFSLPVWLGVDLWDTSSPIVVEDGAWILVGSALATWLFAFVLFDFLFYWAHRKMHEISFGWAMHVVHHSSEEYNLAVALRQSALQRLFAVPFFLPMALLGIPWVVAVPVAALNSIYQFWIHTKLVGRLGPLEWILNTPSHHRVHHGRDPKYIDKNHAGVFIIWDRMFGTFQKEEEEPTYGVVSPLNSFNPVWAQVHAFRDLWRVSLKCRRLRDVWGVWTKKPGWRPDYLGGPVAAPPIDRRAHRKYHVHLPLAATVYAVLQFVIALYVMFAASALYYSITTWEMIGISVFILLTLSNIGEIFERRRWVYYMEMARLGTAVLVSGLLLAGAPLASVPIDRVDIEWTLFAHVGFAAWLWAMRGTFNRRFGEHDEAENVPEDDRLPRLPRLGARDRVRFVPRTGTARPPTHSGVIE